MKPTPHIYLVCGSGGVGKTTVSAAFGMKLAQSGLKTIVLTIDPAKRLATSLGLKTLSDTPKKIAPPAGIKFTGEFYAMMMDTKHTFDRIVEKHAPNPETAQKIFNNKIYKHLSSMLAGSQEYMAMERLYEIFNDSDYEAIIVDTPPVQNALDFFEAPDKLFNMINNSMLKLLLKPAMKLGRAGFSLFEQGAKQILKVMDTVVGGEFLTDIAEMLSAFQELLGGFQARSEHVKKILQSKNTQFFVVCTTAENSVTETENFAKKILEYGQRPSQIIVNRIYPKTNVAPLESSQKKILHNALEEKADALMELNDSILPLIHRDEEKLARLEKKFTKARVSPIPLFLSDVHDLTALAKIAEHLRGEV